MIDIYSKINFDPELERKFEAIEKALGFKLFIWQKTLIAHGQFRQYGATTAEILRDLLAVDAAPIDYTRPIKNRMEAFYKKELRDIKEKLDSQGIPTRNVFFTNSDKEKYKLENQGRRQPEASPYEHMGYREFGMRKPPIF